MKLASAGDLYQVPWSALISSNEEYAPKTMAPQDKVSIITLPPCTIGGAKNKGSKAVHTIIRQRLRYHVGIVSLLYSHFILYGKKSISGNLVVLQH